jgi:uncharacterized membrane protein YfcA
MACVTVIVVLVVVGAALLASVAQGFTGFGFALTAMPFFLLVLDVQDAVVVSTLAATTSLVLVATRVWREVPWPVVLRLLAGSVIGMPLGLAVLLFAPGEALRAAVGLVVVVMAGALAFGLRIESEGLRSDLAVGTASGVLRTSTSLAGPPVVLYLQGRGFEPPAFRAALVLFFLIGNVISLGAFGATGVVSGDAVLVSLASVPAVYAGSLLGDRLLRRIDAVLFRRLVLLLLVATALAATGSALQRMVS